MKGPAVAVVMAIELVARPALAQDAPLRHAFTACITQAVELGMLAEMIAPADSGARGSATLVCSGRPAGDLFSAMDGVSSESRNGDTVIRSSGQGIRCMKPPNDNGNCVLHIQAAPPFLDALRRQ
jgi:hypothetical protein